MSITEGLILIGIVSVAFLASLALQTKNLQVQAQENAASTATQSMNRIRELVMNNDAWARTLANNPGLACLRNGTSCSANVGVQTPFNIYNQNDEIVVPTQPSTAGGSANGFRYNGQPCTSFSMAGSEDCPISYFISWQPWYQDSAICQAPCVNPLVRIQVQMIFRPGSNGSVNLNPDNYSFTGRPNSPPALFRSAVSVARVFRLESVGPPGTPGGPCVGTVTRQLVIPDFGTAITGDPTGAVLAFNPGQTQFTLGPGVYNCTASATGYAVGGFTAQLVRMDNPAGTIVGSGSGVAPRWIQSTASFSASFEVPLGMTQDFQFRQTCSSTPGGGFDNFALGRPIAPFINRTVFASLVCTITPNIL